jgi:phosphoribosylanthranilate isomerase
VLTQVYGITTPDDAAMVNAVGPDHVGVVLDEGIATWDSVDEPTMRLILAELRGPVVVALSLATDAARIRRTVDIVQPRIVHLARAEHLDAAALAGLRAAVSPVEVMLTVPVRGPDAPVVAQRLAPRADWLLLDSAHPDTGVVGATGLTHDWAWSAAAVEAVDVPVFLAGGLGPDNVAAAIAAVGPAGVDSETRTSRPDDRRRKDADLVRRFIEEARRAR